MCKMQVDIIHDVEFRFVDLIGKKNSSFYLALRYVHSAEYGKKNISAIFCFAYNSTTPKDFSIINGDSMP